MELKFLLLALELLLPLLRQVELHPPPWPLLRQVELHPLPWPLLALHLPVWPLVIT
jgi:hypothetical protein